jgi:hypothetical protein
LEAGATYFVTKHVGIDLFMGYDYGVWTQKTSNTDAAKQVNAEDDTEKYSSFEMNIGVVVSIGKK